MASLVEVAKYASSIQSLPEKEQRRLIRRKKTARHLSQVGGTLGLAALATRTPQFARVATSRSKTLTNSRALRRVIAAEPRATGLSNSLGVISIGTGSAGSFNYAGIQRAETKADERLIRKRDDKFLRQYRDRISPEGEHGYNELRRTRNRLRLDAGLAAASTVVPVVGAVPAYHAFQGARHYQERMDKIKARAYQRAADGEYGRGRRRPKVEKALPSAPRPKTGFGTRAGGIVRVGTKTFTRRGAIQGTGQLRRVL